MFSNRISGTLAGALAVALTAALSPAAHAAGSHAGGHGHVMSIGNPGDPGKASRTIEVVMYDTRYEPAKIFVETGETVRFVIRNEGELVHEFNIGTATMHTAHQEEMMEMMNRGVLGASEIRRDMMKGGHGMAHDDPNSALLEPGEKTEIVWTFDTEADLEMACNVPGHYEVGMRGNIHLR